MVSNSVCVVHCHPDPSSFSQSVLEAVMSGLQEHPNVNLFRLYKNEEPSSEQLCQADWLILVYPTWWGSLPGRMLEWFQSNFSPWIDGDAVIGESPLRGVGRLTAVATHGASSFVNHLQGEPGRHLLRGTALKLCDPNAEFEWLRLYRSDKGGDDVRRAFLSKVTSSMASTGDIK